jgi:hypothetical protein
MSTFTNTSTFKEDTEKVKNYHPRWLPLVERGKEGPQI